MMGEIKRFDKRFFRGEVESKIRKYTHHLSCMLAVWCVMTCHINFSFEYLYVIFYCIYIGIYGGLVYSSRSGLFGS